MPILLVTARSEEQLKALLAKLKDNAGLQEKLQGAGDLDTAVAMAQEAGFDVSKADWLKYQANQTLALSDEDLEGVSGGTGPTVPPGVVINGAEFIADLIKKYSKPISEVIKK